MGILDRDKWQEILATMAKNKLRTALTALGVFWGVFMLVFLLGMGEGLRRGVFKDFGSGARNTMFLWSGSTTMPYGGYKSGRRIRLNMDDVRLIQDQVDAVDLIAPRNHVGDKPIVYKGVSESYEVRGELTDMPEIEALVIKQGRYINQADVDEARKVAVLGGTVKKVLFDDEDAIGEHVTIAGIDFQVVGVYEPEQLREWTRQDMESVTIPISTMSRAFGVEDRVDYIICSTKSGYAVSEMEAEIRAKLKESKSIHPDDPSGIGGFNREERFQQVQNLFVGIELFLWFVGIGTLLAGIIGVSNIMLIIVKERTKEIGIRKALGAEPRQIISMIITESVFITALSGFIGMAIGTFLIWLIDFLMKMLEIETENFYNPTVNPYVGLTAVTVLVVAGVIAGLVPALQAAKVNPVVALKDE